MSKSGLTYTHVYESVRSMSHVLTPPELKWDAEFSRATLASEYVIHLSCLAHFTPHLAYLAQQILARVGVNAPVIGGPESCCGRLAQHLGHPELEEQNANVAVGKFQRAKTKTVLSVCPDCDETFNQFMDKKNPFESLNVADLLIRNEDALVAAFKPVPMKIITHAHFTTDMRRRDMMIIERMLRRIPGVEILPSTSAIATKTHCSVLFQMSPEAQEEMRSDIIRQGADALVVPYHSCYRQHCALEVCNKFKVYHYLELVAMALGISYSEPYKQMKFFKRWSELLRHINPQIERLKWKLENVDKVIEFSLFPYQTDKAILDAMRSADQA